MSLSSFLIRIIFLALPGIIGSAIYRKLRGKTNQKDWEDFREIALFSLLSYVFYGLGADLLNRIGGVWTFTSLQAIFDERIPISYIEIIFASIIGIFLSFVATGIHTAYLINKIGRLIHVTRRFGDEDVWEFFVNNSMLGWVFVRDHKTNLTYFGWIQYFSDSEKERELLMRDVIVYSNSTGDELYQSRAIYFSRDRYDLTIEIPLIPRKDEGPKPVAKEISDGRPRKGN